MARMSIQQEMRQERERATLYFAFATFLGMCYLGVTHAAAEIGLTMIVVIVHSWIYPEE